MAQPSRSNPTENTTTSSFDTKLMMDAWDPCSPRHHVAHSAWRNSLTPNICSYNHQDEAGRSASRNDSMSNASTASESLPETPTTTRTGIAASNKKNNNKANSKKVPERKPLAGLRRFSQRRKSRRVRSMDSDVL